MKIRLIGSSLLTFLLLCTSCSGVEKEETSRENSSSTLSSDGALSGNPSSNEESEQNEMSIESEEIAMGGEYTPCSEHTISYHYINIDLMRYVGEEQFDIWYENCTPYDEYGRATENMTISAFVDYFDVPREVFEGIVDEWASEERLQALEMTREEYLAENGYTDAQIDAIYSGDQSQINEAFCGDLAYYNPSDGQLYSIYWLSSHTYEDYRKADIPVMEIEKIADTAANMGGSYAAMAEKIRPQVTEYIGVTETSPGDNLCLEHDIDYHAIDNDLILYVGRENFTAWQDTLNGWDDYGRYHEEQTIDAFVNHFGISRETLVSLCDYYSEDQLDAIYSGDQSQINEAFCGDLAYYNPSDGQLYSIYWLSGHTAADYQAAGVPVSEVERILEDAAAMGGSYASLAEAAAPAAEAYALE